MWRGAVCVGRVLRRCCSCGAMRLSVQVCVLCTYGISCLCVCFCICVHVSYVREWVFVSVHVCMCACVYLCVSVYVCMIRAYACLRVGMYALVHAVFVCECSCVRRVLLLGCASHKRSTRIGLSNPVL